MKKILNLFTTAILLCSPVILLNNMQTKLHALNNGLETNIDRFYKYIADLSILSSSNIGAIEIIDLTALTGVVSMSDFKKIYSELTFPYLTAWVGIFSGNSDIKSFSFPTDNWQEDWTSNEITLVEGSEWIGSAYIYGVFKAQLKIQKNEVLNHLLLDINFYAAGDFKTTGSRPNGEIDTGWVIKLA